MRERRKMYRKPVVSPLEVHSKEFNAILSKGHVVDLNEYGLRFITKDELGIGEEYSLHFNLPNDWKMDYIGRIVHKAQGILSNAYGVEFIPGQETIALKVL